MISQKPSQKPPRVTILQDMQSGLAEIVQKMFGLSGDWYKHRDIGKNNFTLGVRHFQLGNIRDAVLRLKMATWMDPTHAEAWYYLGRSLMADGKNPQAIAALTKALKLNPSHEETAYMLALASGSSTPAEKLPKKMPASMVLEHFEAIASGFSEEQVNHYEYTAHIALADAIRAALVPGRIDHTVLELGVGTGLCGSRLRDVSAELTGVDFSGRMLEEAMKVQDAQGKKLYDALIKREVHEFLGEAAPTSYDVVLFCGLLSYIGDPARLLPLAVAALKQGGVLAFTAEKMDGDGFRFDPKAGYFRFSLPYLRALAVSAGLTEASCAEAKFYPDDSGLVCVFKK